MQYEITWLAKQLQITHSGSPWTDNSFKTAVAGVSARLAFRRPPGDRNSIAEIVRHMTAWKEFLVRKLERESGYDLAQQDSFDMQPYQSMDEAAWKRLLKEADAMQARLIALLEKLDPAALAQTVPKRKYRMRGLLNGVLQHDIYHIGQLVLLKKQLKAIEKAEKVK